MIKVTIGTTTDRNEIIVESSKTIKELLEENIPGYDRATNYLDGAAVNVNQVNSSLEELGITDECSLISVVKLDNANN